MPGCARMRSENCSTLCRSDYSAILLRALRLPLFCLFIFTQSVYADAAAETDSKLAAFKEHFAREKQADTYWYYGWLGFSSAILTTSTTLYFTAEPGSRVQKVQPVSMAVSGIGVVTLILFKPKSFAAQAELSAMPEGTPEEKRAKLKKSDEWLEVSANRQRFTTGWFAQTGTITLLGTAALIDAIWINGPWWGLLRFVTSLTIAELKIFTQPTYSRDLYDSRRKAETLSWQLRMLPGEIALVTYF